jgi:hypothetical protein
MLGSFIKPGSPRSISKSEVAALFDTFILSGIPDKSYEENRHKAVLIFALPIPSSL